MQQATGMRSIRTAIEDLGRREREALASLRRQADAYAAGAPAESVDNPGEVALARH